MTTKGPSDCLEVRRFVFISSQSNRHALVTVRIQRLPKPQQRLVMQVIDTLRARQTTAAEWIVLILQIAISTSSRASRCQERPHDSLGCVPPLPSVSSDRAGNRWRTKNELTSMPDRRITVFFYGLFMEIEALRAAGLQPSEHRLASVSGFALRIG